VRIKRHQFSFRGVLTTIIQPQSTRGCGHLSGPGSQRLGTGLLRPGQSWQGGKGDSRDTSTFVTSTVFGKHCECNARKCTNLKRFPPLASHLLLLSHCVLTQHEGQKKNQDHMADSGSLDISEHTSVHYANRTFHSQMPMIF